MPTGIWRISTVLIPQQKYRGHTGATIFSPGPLSNGGFSVGAEVGEDPRKEEANGRGRTGSCRRPADHGRGICFRSPRKGNGSLEALQPNAPLYRGASSPLGADLAPPRKTYNLLLVVLTETGAMKSKITFVYSKEMCFKAICRPFLFKL